MYIVRFQVANYKSFRETKPLEFAQGFNIISGQDNAGKTALLGMLALRFTGHPHRSIKTIPARDTVPPQFSRAIVSFTVSPNELKELMLASPGQYLVPRPLIGSQFAHKIGYIDDSNPSAERLLGALFSSCHLTFTLRF
jgi:AAA domain